MRSHLNRRPASQLLATIAAVDEVDMEVIDGTPISRTVSFPVSDDDFVNGCMLLRACAEGSVEQVRYTINNNAKLITFGDYDRRTALHVAASEGRLDLVILLLDAGANPNRSDRWGGSPLDDAQRPP